MQESDALETLGGATAFILQIFLHFTFFFVGKSLLMCVCAGTTVGLGFKN